MCGPAYSSDLTDAEWNAIGPLLSEPAIGCPARPDLRYVINGILFLLRLGTEIRTKPPWSTAEAYYAQWQADGKWARIVATLLSTRPARTVPPEKITAEDGRAEKGTKLDGG
jgi:transposase